VSLIESDGLVKRSQDAGSFFIWEESGKSDSRMVIDGDVKRLCACARVAVGAIARGANAWLEEAAQLFNIKMKELAWGGAFVTENRRLGRIERTQAIEAVALEDTGKGSFRDGKDHEDLSIGTALSAEGDDLGFELGGGFAWLAKRSGGAILEALGEASDLSALEPFADGFIGDTEGAGGSAERATMSEMMLDQFGSHERSECGISVHSVRAG
jgi:hypothetical protein